LGELAEAASAYTKALHLRREIGQAAAAIDDLAGLARVALQQGDLAQAETNAEEMWQWLQEKGTAGILNPLQVYVTVANVWQANGRVDEAQEALSQANQLLQQQAERFTSRERRRAFLENVSLHREIVARVAQ
jgi:tetratricopeptide (TPR) repeat protein